MPFYRYLENINSFVWEYGISFNNDTELLRSEYICNYNPPRNVILCDMSTDKLPLHLKGIAFLEEYLLYIWCKLVYSFITGCAD